MSKEELTSGSGMKNTGSHGAAPLKQSPTQTSIATSTGNEVKDEKALDELLDFIEGKFMFTICSVE